MSDTNNLIYLGKSKYSQIVLWSMKEPQSNDGGCGWAGTWGKVVGRSGLLQIEWLVIDHSLELYLSMESLPAVTSLNPKEKSYLNQKCCIMVPAN